MEPGCTRQEQGGVGDIALLQGDVGDMALILSPGVLLKHESET